VVRCLKSSFIDYINWRIIARAVLANFS
jgi:hypothetical protein